MLRSKLFKSILEVQSPLQKLRVFSAEAAKATKSNFQEEWENAKPYESIPTMTKFQILRYFLPGGKYYKKQLIDVHRMMHAEFGNLTKFPALFGRPEMCMAFAVEDFEKLFRFEGHFPFRRTLETLEHYRKKVRPDIYGEYGSLVTEQGENWYKMRTLVNPIMLKPNTVKLYVPQVDQIAKDFISMIMNKRDANSEVPASFSDYMNMWSLESITCISLNVRLGMLNENYHDENAKKLIQFIRAFFVKAYDFEVINPSVWRYYETKAFKELLKVYDGLTEIIMSYVDKAVKDIESQPPQEGREESILEKLLKINKKVAVVMCADAMLAGVDTTSSATIGILYCLAKNPEKQQKLRDEINQLLPNKTDDLTQENMRNMPYLRAVIKEGMRLYPPTAGNLRRADEDLVLSGYRIPKGTEVAMGQMISYKSDKQFPQSEKFIPERWIKTNKDPECPHTKETAHAFAFLPFGFGPRMCVGRRFAELEIEVLLIRIIQNYKMEWNHEDMKIRSVLVNVPDGDLKFKFTEV